MKGEYKFDVFLAANSRRNSYDFILDFTQEEK